MNNPYDPTSTIIELLEDIYITLKAIEKNTRYVRPPGLGPQ